MATQLGRWVARNVLPCHRFDTVGTAVDSVGTGCIDRFVMGAQPPFTVLPTLAHQAQTCSTVMTLNGGLCLLAAGTVDHSMTW